MKTKELIRQLQEADPSGELECCVQNADIHFVHIEPAYYDGCLQVLIRDESNPYYNIIGAKYVSKGDKIVIHPLSISDAIFENEHLPVDFSELSESRQAWYKERAEKKRKETRDINNDIERDYFAEYMVKRLVNFSEELEKTEVEEAAKEFYNANMGYEDKMPDDILHSKVKGKDGLEWHLSWHERRLKQWDREIKVDFIDGKLTITK